ncbi:MAG: phosphoribosylformylglycinamidine synthase subunit PurS [Bryobacterales bacterium]|nr:phosphoribosylformylglycinamidine synthase subunit PurS [Bryobacterales bacterium]
MKAIIQVALKKTVLDPQGRAITKALQSHGHDDVLAVRQGKFFEIELAPGPSRESARLNLEKLAAEVLANPVIEDYDVTVLD